MQNLFLGARWGRIYHLNVDHRLQVTSLPHLSSIASVPQLS